MLTILGWLWHSDTCKAQYRVEHANAWARAIHRNLEMPHRFVLATDHPNSQWHEFDPLIEPIPLWDDWRNVTNKSWPGHKPQCYVRLRAFALDAREFIGQRFVSIDLDCIVMGHLDPLFDRSEDFLIYHRPVTNRRETVNTYQASMWMMTAGSRKQVWDDFKGEESVKLASQYMGSDQAWIRYKLGPDEAGWTQKDGVYSFAAHIKGNPMRYAREWPKDARILFFQGNTKPWEFAYDDRPRCQNCGQQVEIAPPWVLQRRGAPPRSSYFQWISKFYG